ncbi:hypothetical protein [Actimicrobium sp. CCI2.3]|nr:hypothetical protein [Actimicrobium sp. CCI2.3]MDY7575106.1 hypothetical protein [Actimicrobium sp. CCI2.3]MEB0022553.1 hypothetical protein [Actimicrobium sp. CCI2.3]
MGLQDATQCDVTRLYGNEQTLATAYPHWTQDIVWRHVGWGPG